MFQLCNYFTKATIYWYTFSQKKKKKYCVHNFYPSSLYYYINGEMGKFWHLLLWIVWNVPYIWLSLTSLYYFFYLHLMHSSLLLLGIFFSILFLFLTYIFLRENDALDHEQCSITNTNNNFNIERRRKLCYQSCTCKYMVMINCCWLYHFNNKMLRVLWLKS